MIVSLQKSINELQIVVRNVYNPTISCMQFKNDVIEKVRKVMFDVEDCLSPAEKYINDFILRGTNAALNYLCTDGDNANLMSKYKINWSYYD